MPDATSNLASGFAGSMRPVRSSPIYTLAVLAVAAMMLLLPLVYVALIALTGYGLYWHATEHVHWFEHARGSGSGKAILVGYAGPLLAGGIGILFMVKPLFAPRGTRPEPYKLEAGDEPVLFGFVEVLCRVMGAPVPREIHVNCEVNASASFRRGLWSMVGSDLVLTIGLPLVGGMTLRQLTGVLAHEFGHFTQGLGMRAHYVINRINGWFARVAYDRDGWDERLEEWSQESGVAAVSLVVLLCRLFVWLTRLVLKALMLVAHALSCFMSRQMEFDADLHQVRVVGSGQFEPSFRRVIELSVCQGAALTEARDKWHEKRLPDDLPALIRAIDSELTTDTRSKIFDSARSQKAAFFDTHPALPRRIARATRNEEQGIFQLEVPAAALFKNFADVCRRASYLHYRAVLGGEIFNATFVPTREVVQEHSAQVAAGGAFSRIFGEAAVVLAPISPGTIRAPADPRAALADLKKVRARMAQRQSQADAAAKELSEADDRLIQAHQGSTLLAATMKFMPGALKLRAATREAIDEHERDARNAAGRARAILDPFLEDARLRLTTALSILHVPGAEAKIKDLEDKRERSGQLADACRAAADALPMLPLLRQDLAGLTAVLQHARQQKDGASAARAASRLGEQLSSRLKSLRDRLRDRDYPYASAAKQMSIGDYVAPKVPPPNELGQLYDAAGGAMERLSGFYYRVLAELAQFAEEAESAVGLKASGSEGQSSGTAHPPPD